MRMTTGKLVFLRLYSVTLGRARPFSFLLRKALLRLLVKGKKDKYVASSRFFDPRELNP